MSALGSSSQAMNEGRRPMARILASSPSLERFASILEWLELHAEVIHCDREELLEQAIRRPPDLVMFGIGDDPESDSRTLHVLRRMLPEVPLIFLAEGVTLGQRRSFQEFRPMFWALEVDDDADLQAAISAALKGRLDDSSHPRRT